MKKAIDYLSEAIAKCEADIQKARLKSEKSIGMHMSSKNLFDPTLKKEWDRYFRKSNKQRMIEHERYLDEAIALEGELRKLHSAKFSIRD